MARLGRLTRKQADQAIRRGRVCVEGVVLRDPGARLPDEAAVTLDGGPLTPPPRLAVFHKPVGVQSTVGDPRGRRSLAEEARALLELGLHPVGRLDADTSGLLPFSADGALTQRLLHPRHRVPKVYVATVEGEPGPALVDRLAEGVQTSMGVHTAEVHALDGSTVTLAVTEGKHRMVRRMLANTGFPVVALHRIAFGALSLGDLAPGAWRPASQEEAAWAEELAPTASREG